MAPPNKIRRCRCGETNEEKFYRYRSSECKTCVGKRTSARQRGNKELHRKRHLKRAYGLTDEQYDNMLAAQHGLCALCGRPPVQEKLMVDHDHETNELRGLIHRHCNSLLGFAKDDTAVLMGAIQYLNRFRK